MKKHIRTASSEKVTEISAIVIGVLSASIVCFLLTIGLTSIVMNGTVGETTGGLYIFGIRMVAAFVGCVVSTLLMKGKYLLMVGAVSIGYLAVMIATGIVMYDESFKNVLSGVVSVSLGGVIACLVVLKPLKKTKVTARYR